MADSQSNQQGLHSRPETSITIRKAAGWMTTWDDRILEYCVINEAGSPTKIAESEFIHVGVSQISRRLQTLADKGLLTELGNGVYQLSTKGKHYLIGNFDAQEHTFIDETISDVDVKLTATTLCEMMNDGNQEDGKKTKR